MFLMFIVPFSFSAFARPTCKNSVFDIENPRYQQVGRNVFIYDILEVFSTLQNKLDV
jgi:hypothetical protein